MLIALSAAAITVANGCAMFRSESELDSALEQLDYLLQATGDQPDEDLVALSRAIGDQARRLIEAHDDFEREFNELARDRNLPDHELTQLVVAYDTKRRELRNDLLKSQDELLDSVPADVRPEVLEALTRKQYALAPGRVQEG